MEKLAHYMGNRSNPRLASQQREENVSEDGSRCMGFCRNDRLFVGDSSVDWL
jgi:hypothetical protein